ncbi:hypothetical protein DFJ74DRAFT_617852 [Hyaloraphidium curvatum]|nr:hypothetical protein DFJ74DRAFT_617852 [Hyaloraphidium curvatum]
MAAGSAKAALAAFPDLPLPFTTDQQAVFRQKFMDCLSTNSQKMERVKFRELLLDAFPPISETLILERMFRVFDVDLDGLLSWEEALRGLAVFTSPSEQPRFCFRVYDLNADGFLSKDEMIALLRTSLPAPGGGQEDADDAVRELVDLVHRRLDHDRDGKVSLSDFTSAVTREPLLMQCLGACLPTRKSLELFLAGGDLQPAKPR